ncbi:MAG: PH domain-containing protein [Ruminococcus sp.]|nr:PH domain-containing protein [Ruminococcus sp.]
MARTAMHKKANWLRTFFRHRQHPLKILIYTSKNIWLLAIPLTKYLIASKFDFQNWIKTNWVDILTIVVIFGLAFFRWVFVYYETESDGIVAHTGLFGMMTTKVYYSEITTMSCCQSYLQRLFNACTLYIETNAKSLSGTEIKLDLREKCVNEIYDIVTAQCKNNNKMTIKPKQTHLLIFSLLFSSAVSGMIIFGMFMFQLYRFVGREIEEKLITTVNGEITKVNLTILRFTSSIPKIIQITALTIIGGWLLSFIVNLMRHCNFKATRCGSQLLIKSGVLIRRRYVINRDKINYFDYQKSLLMKLFRICSVTIHCTGYGARYREISALIPITTMSEVRASLKILEPQIPHTVIEIKTTPKDIPRFMFMPVVYGFIPPIAGGILKLLFPSWSKEIDILMVIALIPFAWKLIVAIVASYNTSVGFKNGYCTLRYCHFYKFHKIIMPKENISKTVVSQTLFQKISHTCNLKIYTNSEKTCFHRLKNLPLEKTLDLYLREGLQTFF